MISLPNFPTESLYGSFPAFPSYAYKAGWTILGHFYGFSVQIPNLAGIPGWIIDIFIWALGWIAALCLYLVELVSIGIADLVLKVIDLAFSVLDSAIKLIQAISAQAGIFSLPVAALLYGLLLVAIVLVVYAVLKVVIYLVELL